MTDPECEPIRDALRVMGSVGVTSFEVTVTERDSTGVPTRIKVLYKGPAPEANVFSGLNFRTRLRPKNCALLVYKDHRP